LHAVAALVAAVAVAALVRLILRRRRTDPASAPADGKTAPPSGAAVCRGSDTARSWRPAHSPRPAGPPSRFARTTAVSAATRCPDRSAGSTPASAGYAASWCPRANAAAAAQRTDRAAVAHRGDRRASRRPIGAGDAVPSRRAAPAPQNPWPDPAPTVRPETRQAADSARSPRRRLR